MGRPRMYFTEEDEREAARRRNREYYARTIDAQRSRSAKKNKTQSHRDSFERCRARNREIIRLAKDRPCADCNKQYPTAAMDLDHVRGVKIKNVAALMTGSSERLLEEIAKCDVRCAVCHRLRHASEGGE